MKTLIKHYLLLWVRCLVMLPTVIVTLLCRILVGSMALVSATILGDTISFDDVYQDLIP